MGTYVPGTLETDQKKVIMSLQQIGPKLDTATANIATNTANIATNTANIATNTTNISTLQTKTSGYESAWTSYTPTISAASGTITTSSATGAYKANGKTVFINIAVTITTNGTGAGTVKATLPLASKNATNLMGRDIAITGNTLAGTALPTASTIDIIAYNNTYPGTNGAILVLSGVYETT